VAVASAGPGTFLVLAYLGSPGKRAVKRVCVCVLYKFIDVVCAVAVEIVSQPRV